MVRRKQRYLLLQIDAEGKVAMSIPGGKDITERLKESVRVLFGDLHAGLLQWSFKGNDSILQCCPSKYSRSHLL